MTRGTFGPKQLYGFFLAISQTICNRARRETFRSFGLWSLLWCNKEHPTDYYFGIDRYPASKVYDYLLAHEVMVFAQLVFVRDGDKALVSSGALGDGVGGAANEDHQITRGLAFVKR